MRILKNGWTILKAAFNGFINDKALKYSASLAYYTIFSIAPLLLLVISTASVFFGKDAIQGKVFSEINGLVDNDAAKQIQDMIKHLGMSGKPTISPIGWIDCRCKVIECCIKDGSRPTSVAVQAEALNPHLARESR